MIYVTILLLLVSSIPASAAVPARASSPQANILAPITKLTLEGERGDFIVGDQELTFTPADGPFHVQTNDLGNAVNIFFISQQNFWILTFNTGDFGTRLVPGVYNRARRFGENGHPGLDVSGDGRGCNESSGKFVILDAQFDHSVSPARVVSFAAQFEQHCEGMLPGLFGTIYYNYTPRVNLSLDHVSITAGGRANGAVSIDSPAPPGGVTVELASNNPSLVMVPPTVVIPEGRTLRTFPVQTAAIKARPRAQIMATLDGVSTLAELIVNPPVETKTEFLFRVPENGFTFLVEKDDAVFFSRVEASGPGAPQFLRTFINTDAGPFFFIDFSTRQLGIPLRPSFYPNAEITPFESPGHPGLDVSGFGSGCSQLTGEFTILEAVFDDTFSPPLVVSFGADYKRFTCGADTTLLDGHFYFNFGLVPSGGNFDISLQDESNGNLLRINSSTGDYQFTSCPSGLTMGGKGTISLAGGLTVLQHNAADRRVIARIDRGANRGTASIGLFSPQATFTITDRNMSNNSNACP